MAIVKRTRSAQYPMVADFVFNYNDGFAVLSALNAASQDSNPRPTITDFGSKSQPTGMLSGSTYVANTNAATNYFEMISLPLGAQVIGGEQRTTTLGRSGQRRPGRRGSSEWRRCL